MHQNGSEARVAQIFAGGEGEKENLEERRFVIKGQKSAVSLPLQRGLAEGGSGQRVLVQPALEL